MCLSLVLFLAQGPRAEELPNALARLSSPLSAERELAERWLAGQLESGDYPVLSAALLAGDAEVHGRVARALGARDQHIELAARLWSDSRPPLREVGRAALYEQLGHWQAILSEPAVRGPGSHGAPGLNERLSEYRERFRWLPLRMRSEGTLEERVDRLARLGQIPVGIAIDPACSLWFERWSAREANRPGAPGEASRPGASGEAAPLEGSWDELLAALVSAPGPLLEGPARFPDWGEPLQPFVIVCTPSNAGPALPRERLCAWVAQFAAAGEPQTRAAAARALAGSGWPAAITWLGERWRERQDEAALEGALLAAGRGAVADAFYAPQVERGLIELADADLEGRTPAGLGRAEALMRALAQVGPLRGDGGQLADLLLADFDARSARQRCWRLAVLEVLGGADARVTAACRASLAAPAGTHPPALLVQALRTLCATSRTGAVSDAAGLADPAGLLSSVRGPEDGRELGRLLVRSRLAPPDKGLLAALAEALRTPSARGALFEWLLGAGQIEAAARELTDLDVDSSAAILAAWAERGEGAAARAVLEAVRAGPRAAPAVERIALLAGLLPAERHAAALAAALAGGPDVPALASLCDGPERESARAALLRELQAVLAEDPAKVPPEHRPGGAAADRLTGALEQALLLTYSGRRDTEAEGFADAVSALLRQRRRHPLAQAMSTRPRDWPWLPPAGVLDLDALERRLDSSLP